jgi:outer membrane protein assembly factor BamB
MLILGDSMMRNLRFLLVLLVLPLAAVTVWADDWPQWLGPQRDGVWRETGILDKFPSGGPKVRWRVPIGGGYAGPAVANGKVIVIDRVLAKGEKDPDNPFTPAKSAGEERVLCLSEKDGHILWTHSYPCKYEISYPCGPRCTPVVKDGKVYTLGAMGNLNCLDIDKGTVIWSKDFKKDYQAPTPTWGFAANPLLDGDKLICLVGGPGSEVVAFDKNTGKEVWKSLSIKNAEIGYCPPMIFQVGKTRQLIIWDPQAVHGLNPETGAEYWSEKFFSKANLTIPTPRLAGDKLLLTCFYNGSMLLQLDQEKPAAKVVWKGMGRGEAPSQTDGLHAIMCTPFIKDGYIYGVCSYGELRCLKLDTGERVWQDLRATGSQKEPIERWANAFIIPQGERYFLFNEKGDLIMAKLTPQGYEELDRAHIIDPTGQLSADRGKPRLIVWSYPAFANKSVYVRSDKEIVCVSLAAE